MIYTILLAVLGYLLLIIAIVALLYLARSRGEESCCEDCDDWMDIADVVSDDHAAGLRVDDDHFAEDYADGVCLEGFTPQQTAVLRANYLPLCDDERIRLGVAFLSIVEGADR